MPVAGFMVNRFTTADFSMGVVQRWFRLITMVLSVPQARLLRREVGALKVCFLTWVIIEMKIRSFLIVDKIKFVLSIVEEWFMP